MPYAPIQDYAVVGDGRSVALVSRSGSIDWLCWPRFDSPSIFAAILDDVRGGRFSVAPVGASRSTRSYEQETNVLVTRFETDGGTVTLTDLMAVAGEEEKHRLMLANHELLRVARCEHGEVLLEVRYAPRPEYGRVRPRLKDAGRYGVRCELREALLTLRSNRSLRVENGAAVARVRLRAGEVLQLSLTYDDDAPAVLAPLGRRVDESVDRTRRWWRAWAGRARYDGPAREAVIRSALLLKLLSFAPSGAIVAAPTTSLPERIGGELNFDYRFAWVRDASLTVRVFMELGYAREADAFLSWLLHSTRLTRPEVRTLYEVYGRRPKDERSLDHLEGHRGSRPVRVGNAASDQLQLDSYGEVIDAASIMVRHGAELDGEERRLLRAFGRYVLENWDRPDQGMWEPRAPPRHHTHSRLMSWVALSRLIELNERGALPKVPADRYRKARERIAHDIETRGWNPGIRSYTGTLGGEEVDAALLLMTWYEYADARSPRMRDTWRRIVERLSPAPGLLYRYEPGLRAGEGAFGIACFWAVEYLARGGGRVEDAREWFEATLRYGNDVGLYAEEIAPARGDALGNFPQAFTHVGLINAALSLHRRAEQEQERRPGGRDRSRAEVSR